MLSLPSYTHSSWDLSSRFYIGDEMRSAYRSGISRSSSQQSLRSTYTSHSSYWLIRGMGYILVQLSFGSCPSSFPWEWLSSKVRRSSWIDVTGPILIVTACNARVLTVYERQRRMTRNFLEGARKERIQYTPTGLWKAWINLNAATKVYVLTLVGLIVSVGLLLQLVCQADANMCSSCPRSSFTLAQEDFMAPTVSSEKPLGSWSAAKALNGQCHMLASSLIH